MDSANNETLFLNAFCARVRELREETIKRQRSRFAGAAALTATACLGWFSPATARQSKPDIAALYQAAISCSERALTRWIARSPGYDEASIIIAHSDCTAQWGALGLAQKKLHPKMSHQEIARTLADAWQNHARARLKARRY